MEHKRHKTKPQKAQKELNEVHFMINASCAFCVLTPGMVVASGRCNGADPLSDSRKEW